MVYDPLTAAPRRLHYYLAQINHQIYGYCVTTLCLIRVKGRSNYMVCTIELSLSNLQQCYDCVSTQTLNNLLVSIYWNVAGENFHSRMC